MARVKFVGASKRVVIAASNDVSVPYWINAVGIRFDDREFKIGQRVPRSNDWIDGVPTNSTLPGTCTIGIGCDITTSADGEILVDAPDDYLAFDEIGELAKQFNYAYEHAYVVIGEDAGYGEDIGEQIITDARVITRLW